MITQIIRKQLFCVTNVRVIGKKNLPRQLVCVCVCNWHVHGKYLMKSPNYTKEFLPESPV